MSELSMAAVRAMRDYAEKMPPAVASLERSRDELITVFNSMSDRLGGWKENYLAMILAVSKFLDEGTEPILVLAQDLENKANEIEHRILVGGNPT